MKNISMRIGDLRNLYILVLMKITFAAYIEKDPETGFFIGIIPDLPGAHSQGETLDELSKNLQDVIDLCMEEMSDAERETLPQFAGIQNIEVAV